MRYKHFIAAAMAGLIFTGGAVAADKFNVDTAHTSINFSIRHMGISNVRGNFKQFSGTILFDEDDATKIATQLTIKTASINTSNEGRDAHLRKAEFFDAEKFPELTFVSKRVEKKGDSLVCIGDLTMKGVTKEVAIPFTISGKVKDPKGKTHIGLAGSTTVNRQDFGISYGEAMIGNDVKIEFEVEAIQE